MRLSVILSLLPAAFIISSGVIITTSANILFAGSAAKEFTYTGDNPLLAAVTKGDADAVKSYLDKGISANARGRMMLRLLQWQLMAGIQG